MSMTENSDMILKKGEVIHGKWNVYQIRGNGNIDKIAADIFPAQIHEKEEAHGTTRRSIIRLQVITEVGCWVLMKATKSIHGLPKATRYNSKLRTQVVLRVYFATEYVPRREEFENKTDKTVNKKHLIINRSAVILCRTNQLGAPEVVLKSTNMMTCFRPGFLLAVSAVLITTASVRFCNKSGAVRWSYGCDFNGNDMLALRVPNWDCGRQCVNNAACTHFTNTLYTCLLKRNVHGWREINSPNTDCGFIVGRSRQSHHVIRDFLHNDVL
ncbi:hypothetical protein GHT06_013918 [Daphnia sinensis]|uniref:Apple domain-containing protein n=1 Tax=Daphnia sinensis TaxID=1820382 RepID=A0AAD5KSX7_9CRUS|nr:hypothetical protein GHT06_013918 [Daphnia sinensis]